MHRDTHICTMRANFSRCTMTKTTFEPKALLSLYNILWQFFKSYVALSSLQPLQRWLDCLGLLHDDNVGRLGSLSDRKPTCHF